jgi:hypothetical protein
MPTVLESMRMVGTLSRTTMVPFQVSKPGLPAETGRVRITLPFSDTVMVFAFASILLTTAAPIRKVTTRCCVPSIPPPASTPDNAICRVTLVPGCHKSRGR